MRTYYSESFTLPDSMRFPGFSREKLCPRLSKVKTARNIVSIVTM
ncbi:hypothetical protein MmTuc01_2147 [Methanosarcina mazei Tuc01]|uniref:Uncharacterized protein n=1 Tax=Methanosarcina mazei Tuc01 TaxID=1236903 RepID=M1Q5A3_METMZ|nr:hypothetical protein MmTuc01_2147 [Methanosarcina mazei Tuc01]